MERILKQKRHFPYKTIIILLSLFYMLLGNSTKNTAPLNPNVVTKSFKGKIHSVDGMFVVFDVPSYGGLKAETLNDLPGDQNFYINNIGKDFEFNLSVTVKH